MFIFSGIKSLLPKFNVTIIDNHIFRFHYRCTVIILVAFIILKSAKDYFGDPIKCSTIDKSIKSEILDLYCWIQSTYSLPEYWHTEVGKDIIYPGVGKHTPGMAQVYHKYYQWVIFMLFLQAVSFYIPRYLWKMAEGGKINMLVLGLDCPLIGEKEKSERIQLLTTYIIKSRKTHGMYAASYYICESLNFVNIIGQLYLTDHFLGNEFSKFGLKVLEFVITDPQNRTDPMSMVFPRITKCTFYQFGFAGSVEMKDSFCILPLNIINEKIYIFLWFWFLFLAFITFLGIIYRIFTLIPWLRVCLLNARTSLVPKEQIRKVLSEGSLGDWFLLYLLSKNIDPMHFQALFDQIAEGIGPWKKRGRLPNKDEISVLEEKF